jgi:hypothetical protein
MGNNMQEEAILVQLGYVPNEALLKQLKNIQNNTTGYDKIKKHIMDLHEHLKVDKSFVAMSNSNDYFKIKIEAQSKEMKEAAHQKVQHFSEIFKVEIKKLDNKETYYIICFKH